MDAKDLIPNVQIMTESNQPAVNKLVMLLPSKMIRAFPKTIGTVNSCKDPICTHIHPFVLLSHILAALKSGKVEMFNASKKGTRKEKSQKAHRLLRTE